MTDSNVVPVRTSLPPITHGISIRSACISWSRASTSARSGLPAVYARTGSFDGGGGLKMPWTLTRRLYVEPVARDRVLYEADGFGVGELLLEEDVLLWHELPRPGP